MANSGQHGQKAKAIGRPPNKRGNTRRAHPQWTSSRKQEKPGEQWTPPSQPCSQRLRCKCNCKCHSPGPWFEEINQQLQEADSLGQAKKKQIRVLTGHRSSLQCRECCRASALDAEFFHIDTRTERRFTLGQGIYQHEIAIVRLQYKLPWTEDLSGEQPWVTGYTYKECPLNQDPDKDAKTDFPRRLFRRQ